MFNSILQIFSNDIKEFCEMTDKVLKGEKDTADLSFEVQKRMLDLGCRIIGAIYEEIDKLIFESVERKNKYSVEHKDMQKELVDVMGTIRFKRRGYVSKKDGEYIYLLDQILGFEDNQKISLGAAAKLIEEAAEMSYEKAGNNVNLTDQVSKETVKNLVHGVVVDLPVKELAPEKKKKVKDLHIVADEDHVSAQFWETKGDLEKTALGQKKNTIQDKIIVLYEGVKDTSPAWSSKHRYQLVGKRTFCGLYSGTENNYRLWQEVQDYISANYDLDVLERVYVAGDGAGWIRAGAETLLHGKFVLDKFHMMKYINQSVTHLEEDDAIDMKNYIWECIDSADKLGLKKAFKDILEKTVPNSNKYNDVRDSRNYFINNWDGVKVYSEDRWRVWKCCAEAQVSHVLSERLSSRPMGWSEHGCDNISKLRAFKRNGGKVIDLLRYQKRYQEIEKKRQKQDRIITEIRQKRIAWKYDEVINKHVVGLENSSMKWLRDIINQKFE